MFDTPSEANGSGDERMARVVLLQRSGYNSNLIDAPKVHVPTLSMREGLRGPGQAEWNAPLCVTRKTLARCRYLTHEHRWPVVLAQAAFGAG